MPYLDFDINIMLWNIIIITVAYIISLPIAWDREKETRSAGLRTFPLVAMATCGFALLGISLFDNTDSSARILQGLITGIGFIGGGAILKNHNSVNGTATAASLWCVGLIGIATAYGKLEIAIIISIIAFITLRYIKLLK